MMKKSILLIFLIGSSSLGCLSQEIITGLSINPVIRAAYEQVQAQSPSQERAANEEVTSITLPFFDDFTQTWPYPEESLWLDKTAYVNSNFGYRSATWGVATLDAIDSKGMLHANASQFPFSADSLTSRPIRLDSIFSPVPRAITIADSIYLSFYYQPQGRANPPEGPDSLILQFGYFTGDSVFAYAYDSIFVPVSLYITEDDTIYPGDTVYSPPECDNDLFTIADGYYFYNDLIQVPCDSIYVPEFRWKRVWSSKGMSLQDFYELYGTYSRQVMIPITDSLKYFKKNFFFRFINHASLASDFNASWKSNCDQWNLDYVYLNIGRDNSDTIYRRLGFVERAPGMLKNYEAMPFPQYVNDPTNETKAELEMVMVNLDTSNFTTAYYYAVYQVDGPFEYVYLGGKCNLYPFIQNGYQNCINCAAHACPPVDFIFPLSLQDSSEFEIRHFLIGEKTAQDTIRDTVIYRQKFFNYYAYDDGTPEEGYGLTPAGSWLAYRFKLNVKDTLRAVQMFFNRTLNNANEQLFNLMVWRDNNGKPGDVIYSQLNQMVAFSDDYLDFHTYMLDQPVPVNGTFYIGWEQQSNDNLNLGFDRYNNAQQNIFYNTTGEWFQSTFQGALMMRPMLGKAFELSGVDDPVTAGAAIVPYPNPLNGRQINFRCSGKYMEETQTRDLTVAIFSIQGYKLYEGIFQPSIDAGELAPGLYIIRITDPTGQAISLSKLIKN
jgi:hypothetical protein